MISDDTIFELKCTECLKPEFIIQLAIYAYSYNQINIKNNIKKYKLINLNTKEIIEIKYNEENIFKMINFLLERKNKDICILTDEEFINDNINNDIYDYNNINNNPFTLSIEKCI